MYRSAGMNVFLATSRYGQELGSEAIRLLAHQHIRDLRLRTGVLSQGQDHAQLRAHPRRVWHSGLLVDVLSGEFRP
jgi:hypothetical protein